MYGAVGKNFGIIPGAKSKIGGSFVFLRCDHFSIGIPIIIEERPQSRVRVTVYNKDDQ